MKIRNGEDKLLASFYSIVGLLGVLLGIKSLSKGVWRFGAMRGIETYADLSSAKLKTAVDRGLINNDTIDAIRNIPEEEFEKYL